ATVLVAGTEGSTSMIALAGTGGWLSAPAVAVLSYVPPLAAVVALMMWTECDAPGAMSPNAQFSVWLGAEPVMEQVPAPAYAGSIDQLTPSPAGSGSDNVTAVAVPVPSAPEFETVTVNPIESPV